MTNPIHEYIVEVTAADRDRLIAEKLAWDAAGFADEDLMPVPRQLGDGSIFWEIRPKVEMKQ